MPSIPDKLLKQMADQIRRQVDRDFEAMFGAATTSNTAGNGPELTLKSIKEVEKIASRRECSVFDGLLPRRGSLLGMDIIEAPPPQPKLQWRQLYFKDGTPMGSPKVRAEMNAFLAERFGYQKDIFKDRAYIMSGHTIISPKSIFGLIADFGA